MLANKQPKYEKARSDESDEEFGLEMQEIDITSPKSKHVIAKHRKESFSDSEKVTDEASLVVQESSEDEIKVKREDTELASYVLPLLLMIHLSFLPRDFKTFGNTVISFIGSGILGLPFAFRQAGLLVSAYATICVNSSYRVARTRNSCSCLSHQCLCNVVVGEMQIRIEKTRRSCQYVRTSGRIRVRTDRGTSG